MPLTHGVSSIRQDDKLVLEASVYAWALEKPLISEDAPGEMVGGNFGVPHRDAAYLVSHTDAGLPNILGLWIPVVSREQRDKKCWSKGDRDVETDERIRESLWKGAVLQP